MDKVPYHVSHVFITCFLLVYCMDVKMNIDDNSKWRQPKLFEMRDYSQEDPKEVEAIAYDLNYIKLDGSIGCVGKWVFCESMVTSCIS